MNREKVYYSDPLFEELIANVPADISREFSLRHDVAARIEEIIRRKGWSQADFAKAMNKKESEISKWLGGGHNFTLATIAKIETILEESVISVRKYRKTVTGYNQSPEAKRRLFSDGDRHKYPKQQ